MKYSLDFSAVIFDLDGTLLYTLEEIAAAGNAALLSQGYAEYPVEAYRNFVGAGAAKLAWRILPESKRNKENHDEIFPALLEEFERVLNTIARPYLGVLEVLSALSSADKKIAVLSNKPDEFTKKAVKKFLPDTDFFAVRGGVSDVPLKPAPDGAIKLAEEMGVEPEHTVFVGDSDVDIQTAVNAGMIAVGAGWGFRGAKELINAGAKIVFDEPLDLLGLL
ncbi:HAD family hydrolase [Maridesulfovibrio zosterae]|uniref:HAD family hydrolase n=1 Tax=Maridesulfovibrio zosterae TaxID=82171 RepID=UPI0004006682|nr:HAD family hydrolase [Maridesulfovibrio zosterae]